MLCALSCALVFECHETLSAELMRDGVFTVLTLSLVPSSWGIRGAFVGRKLVSSVPCSIPLQHLANVFRQHAPVADPPRQTEGLLVEHYEHTWRSSSWI